MITPKNIKDCDNTNCKQCYFLNDDRNSISDCHERRRLRAEYYKGINHDII